MSDLKRATVDGSEGIRSDKSFERFFSHVKFHGHYRTIKQSTSSYLPSRETEGFVDLNLAEVWAILFWQERTRMDVTIKEKRELKNLFSWETTGQVAFRCLKRYVHLPYERVFSLLRFAHKPCSPHTRPALGSDTVPARFQSVLTLQDS